MAPNLDLIPPGLHESARRALDERDPIGFLVCASNEYSILLCRDNRRLLEKLGMLEATFVQAVTATRTNNFHEYARIARLLHFVDRSALLAAGDPLPHHGPFTAYRGVWGHGQARRLRGYSWTLDPERAEWFARRFDRRHPAVFETTIPLEFVGFYLNDRNEQELFAILPADHPIRRVWRATAASGQR